jgi:integrase
MAPARLDPRRLPATDAGIQLFFVGTRDADTWASGDPRPESAGALPEPAGTTEAFFPGQQRLCWVPTDPARIDVARAARAGMREMPRVFSSVETFGEARGWSPVAVQRVQLAVGVLLAGRVAEDVVDPAAFEHLRGLGLPHTPTREFLEGSGVLRVAVADPLDAWLERRFRHLPEQIRAELRSWTDVLRGRARRGCKPQLLTTVKTYVAACAAGLDDWGRRYRSLRQVTVDDVEAQLACLSGWKRVSALTGLRSLFKTLKGNRLVFADPTAGVRVPAPDHRLPVGIEAAVRACLLERVDGPDRRLIVLLVGVHALTRGQIARLRLYQVDLAGNRLIVDGRPRVLDALTREHLVAWLEHRRRRWPKTSNPHLLVTSVSANRLTPVSSGYLRSVFACLPVTGAQLRVDRLVSEALNGGDALRIALLFGLSPETATTYAAAFEPFDREAYENDTLIRLPGTTRNRPTSAAPR